ncbi:hypothetical protein [Pseudogemmobacter faecipullorum]|uniref:Uncharacterized protein n=1 Tax=Pseudogemmobacter faecipullorum TaxID=2755041 RepID=A0ABS8CPJ7_9RHOB|nr:hypothetical protein [Pseudogemmobacter faecipullorum]MCB5411321.1 hypothetical protein [Pseudogemmobacter faecipullorum]
MYSVDLAPLSLDQFSAFQDWYVKDLAFGTRPFVFPHPITRQPGAWKIVKADPPYRVTKSGMIAAGSDRRRVNLSFSIMSQPHDLMTSLFSGGRAGILIEDFNPANRRLFADAAGLVPALLPGGGVGRVRRRTGTVDAIQTVTASRPILIKWPKGGRRNLLNLNTFSAAISPGENMPPQFGGFNFSRAGGTVLTFVGRGEQNGLPYIDFRISGDPVTTSFCTVSTVQRFSATLGRPSVSSGYIKVPTGAGIARATVSTGQHLGAAFVRYVDTEVVLGTPEAERYVCRSELGGGADSFSMVWRFFGTAVGTPVDAVVRLALPQFEFSSEVSPAQLVTSANEITEPGVPDVWHLASGALPVMLPLGEYGRAFVNYLGALTVDSVTNPSDALLTARLSRALLRQGAFTPVEEARIRQAWGGGLP